jgi:protein MpaA
MRKLGTNHGGYRGERLDLPALLEAIERAAQLHGWERQCFGRQGEFDLVAWHRPGPPGARHIYVSSGIHGDEPAGPLAVARLLAENLWPQNTVLWVVPCLNPGGFLANTRENPDGLDLNRDYRTPRSAEVRAHIAWLEELPAFEVALCLHEDWESHGFYLYEINPDQRPSRAGETLAAAAQFCPVDVNDVIEGWPAKDGIIRPQVLPRKRPDWPEALYFITAKTRLCYTLEAPSDFPLTARVAALTAATRAALGR